MSKKKKVALLIETSNSYARGLLRGIASYIHEKNEWSVYLPEQERGATPPNWLNQWDGDGVIARIENSAIAKAIAPLDIPVVDVSAARQLPEIPFVETDDEAIAAMAYRHFRERGFETFAYCGDSVFTWSNHREKAFVRCAAEEGYGCSVYVSKSHKQVSPDADRGLLTQWLKGLPKPVGLLACYDKKAHVVLEICRENDLRVPFEIAVLGIDDDDLICDLCTPPLSSITPAAHQTGRKAAEMLDDLMNNKTRRSSKKTASILVPPIGLNTRQSTDIVAIDDPDIANAVRFIRDHFRETITVQDILKRVPLSRRILEYRFQDRLGCSPHEEIARRRLENVRMLLRNSDLTLAQIASQSGFQTQEYMSVAFRRATGKPPGQYRREHRGV
ncbi:xylose operon transcription regulator XylR [Rhodopirellula sp. SWK7]|uniref:AraC family transcriptional regulator n=1 Tax=Rhodopirellula sp. SWK7 TaxID=595460 RepID=UPI0002BEC605|nr:DNA-binding transcriptional regulator [Rhodopirellula sp. SWK7]EMI44305.1 xylose operon regulatory protein [Rhodopirellula sp. SWK7]